MRPFDSNLFQLEQVEPGLWLLSEKMVRAGIRSNVWVVEGQQADLVIDAGWGIVDWPFEEIFQPSGKPLWIALTHAHCDHVSQVFQFKDRCFGHHAVKAVVEAPTAKNTNAQPWAPQLKLVAEGFEYLNFDAKSYGHHFKPGVFTDVVGEGDTIDLGGVVLEILETPGHSSDSLTFIDRSRQWMFTGDVLTNGYIVDILPDSDKRAILHVHKRLMAQDFKRIFGGHHAPMDRETAETVVARYAQHKAEQGVTLD
ncbi:MAG: MBL fold metallo-hydrolase [Alphaproteobacteria bacterium TMED89]|nr:hypothetical protein [Rhodospirillaceae bacterium]RPH14901.1 MAG: MBL fold metallo-hydrolase [Alphaproteobacteria bacterium TMED89]